MAKYNLFLGTAKGKVGDVVMYRYAGQQCSRVRVREISNPKSEAQQIQRSIASTVVNAYSALKSICNHSFENIPYKLRSMNYFNKINMDLLRSKFAIDYNEGNTEWNAGAAVTAPNISTFIPNAYVISKGSLTKPFVWEQNSGSPSSYNMTFDGLQSLIDSASEASTAADDDSITVATNSTVGELLDAIGLADPNTLYTFVVGNFPVTNKLYEYSDANNASIWETTIHIARLVRNDTQIDSEVSAMTISEAFSTTENITTYIVPLFDTAKTTVNYMEFFGYLYAITQNNTKEISGYELTELFNTYPDDFNAVCFASIYSKYEDDKWKRSSETMQLSNKWDEALENVGLIPYYAVPAWTQGTVSIGDSDYLLNASE